jgi:EmrB/QacA subfamily drug resistance transporter
VAELDAPAVPVTQPATPTLTGNPSLVAEGGSGAIPWATFAVCAVSSYIATLDMSIVNVAFAEIAASFSEVSRGSISWVVTAYSIMFGSLLVVSGRTADRVGRKRMLHAGLVAFALGSVVCAVAPTLGVLVGGRAAQGIAGALMMPASLGLLLAAFPESRRSQAMAWMGAAGALGVASGPTLGALLVSSFGWRSAFWVNVPVCVAVIVLAARAVREPKVQASARPDVAAAALITVAVASLVWGISRAEAHGWRDAVVLGLIAASAVLIVGVVRRSLRHPVPLIPPALFRDPTFRAANAATFVFGAAFAANILNNVLFLRAVWAYSVVTAGLFSVLAPVVVAATSIVAGRVMRTVGFRPLLVAAQLLFALVVVGQASLLDIEPAPWTRWLPLMLVLGVSIGFTFPVLAASAVATLPPANFGLGGAINNTFRQVGAAVGVALVVTMQSSGEGIAGYRAGWVLVASCGLLAAAISLAQPRRAEARP